MLQDGTWRQALIAGIDAAPPPVTPFPSVEALRAALADHQALFTAADDDAFVPGDRYKAHVARFHVDGHTDVVTLPGGHHAIFLEAGDETFAGWAKTQVRPG